LAIACSFVLFVTFASNCPVRSQCLSKLHLYSGFWRRLPSQVGRRPQAQPSSQTGGSRHRGPALFGIIQRRCCCSRCSVPACGVLTLPLPPTADFFSRHPKVGSGSKLSLTHELGREPCTNTSSRRTDGLQDTLCPRIFEGATYCQRSVCEGCLSAGRGLEGTDIGHSRGPLRWW